MMKRLLSLLLCMVMVLSMVPVQAIAQETAEEPAEVATETEAVELETEPTEEETSAPTEAPTESNEDTTMPMEQPTEPVEEPTFFEEADEIVVETTGSDVAMAATHSGELSENISWKLKNGTLTISGTGVIPSKTRPWNSYKNSIHTVVIQDGITKISGSLFAGLDKLTDVIIADSVRELDERVFMSCFELKNIDLPASITVIPDFAFCNCISLETIRIPENVSAIGYRAFAGCASLRNIQLPSRLGRIGQGAFERCTNLETIQIPDNVAVIESDMFTGCSSLWKVLLPSMLECIGPYAFSECTSLSNIQLPKRLQTIEDYAFQNCGSLRGFTLPISFYRLGRFVFDGCHDLSITFLGGPPSYQGRWYDGVSRLTVYYPFDHPEWAYQVSDDIQVQWVPYGEPNIDIPDELPEEEEPSFNRHNTLESLTELDYLAFSQVAYEDFVMGETVQECLERTPGIDRNKWGNVWGEQGITYAELCEGIAEWEVCHIKENTDTGFYAVAFRNDSGEAVLAYRGSHPIPEIFDDFTGFIKDWWDNDLKMIIYNFAGSRNNQYYDAKQMYLDVLDIEEIHTVKLTGHSLGGLWGDVMSAQYGCEAITFNAISALDIIYMTYPQELGKTFRGIDVWNFMDHASHYDFAAGVSEDALKILGLAAKLKPYISYDSPYGTYSAYNHSMKSMVRRTDNGLAMNTVLSRWKGTKGTSGYAFYHPIVLGIDMGVHTDDTLYQGLFVPSLRYCYGGDGADYLTSGVMSDILIGGRGGDTLDGGWGDDTYYYFKGDGFDTIIDTGGDDKLYLKDFSDDDRIEVYDDPEDDYMYIRCKGERILSIYKKNREYPLFTTNSFKFYVNDGPENDITYLFNEFKAGLHVVIRCPVSIEVLDSEGNVVYNLENNADAVGAHYTDYGNFYVFEEEEGGYGKVLDLAEGYTIRIVGEDTGTMSIEYYDVKDGALAEPKIIEDIPITSGYVATLVEDESGEVYVNPEENVNYTYGQSAQIKLIEPWGLKANAKIMADEVLMDYDSLYDYGVYFIRKSDLDRAGLTQDTITVEDILNDTDAVQKTKADGVTVSGSYLSAIYDNDIYTYELDDSVFVMFYFVRNKGAEPIYVPIRERNLKTLAEQRMNDEAGFPNALERAVYQKMTKLETDVTDYRSDFANLSAPEKQKAPTLAQYPLGVPAAGSSYSYGQNAQIKLIEPWGLKANVKVSQGGSVIDYNAVEEYGIVALADNSKVYNTAAEILQNKNAYVFSSKNGDATISNGYISATYSKDIFTYQLDTDIYVFGYVKDADGYHYGPVRNRNVHTLMEARMNDAVNFPNVKERTVYTDMIELYDAITRYREDYFNN